MIYVETYCRIKIGRFYRNELCHQLFLTGMVLLNLSQFARPHLCQFFVLSVVLKFSKIKNKKRAGRPYFLTLIESYAFFFFTFLVANKFVVWFSEWNQAFFLLFLFEIKMNGEEKNKRFGNNISNFYLK